MRQWNRPPSNAIRRRDGERPGSAASARRRRVGVVVSVGWAYRSDEQVPGHCCCCAVALLVTNSMQSRRIAGRARSSRVQLPPKSLRFRDGGMAGEAPHPGRASSVSSRRRTQVAPAAEPSVQRRRVTVVREATVPGAAVGEGWWGVRRCSPRRVRSHLAFAIAIFVTGVFSGVVGGSVTLLVRSVQHLAYGYTQGPLLLGGHRYAQGRFWPFVDAGDQRGDGRARVESFDEFFENEHSTGDRGVERCRQAAGGEDPKIG